MRLALLWLALACLFFSFSFSGDLGLGGAVSSGFVLPAVLTLVLASGGDMSCGHDFAAISRLAAHHS
ncbi:hypothetical protein V8C37DRAFT_373058 [Trichoderma ceciliae]